MDKQKATTCMEKRKLENLLVPGFNLKNIGTFKRSFENIAEVVANDKRVAEDYNYQEYAADPRDGTPVIQCAHRTRRPHKGAGEECPICMGETTPVISARELADCNYTFMNLNMFPAFVPYKSLSGKEITSSCGLHLMVWPTTEHKDVHELSIDKNASCLEMVAETEHSILDSNSRDEPINIALIKNTGKERGCSLHHGHYQLIASWTLPRSALLDREFEASRGISFTQFLERENPENLEVVDYGTAKLVVPYFMKTPLEAIVYVKDDSKRTLNECSKKEVYDLASAVTDTSRALSLLMPAVKKHLAYNLIFHSSREKKGIYVEILPAMQIRAGFEEAGLFICQNTPEVCADMYRRCFDYMRLAGTEADSVFAKCVEPSVAA